MTRYEHKIESYLEGIEHLSKEKKEELRKFHEWKESGKSGILLGIRLNPQKCIGEKVRRIPINVKTKW